MRKGLRSTVRRSFLKRDHVSVVKTATIAGDDETKLWQLLTNTLNTLKSSYKPLRLKAASERVKNID